MKPPELPENETQRLELLRSLSVLDSEPNPELDRLTTFVARVFNVPIALISLVDSERQWFKSKVGLEASETPRDISFCGHAILSNYVFVVEDALNDPRFCDNPLVAGPPNIRFYAGAPLQTLQGLNLGTLCIIDTEPREFSINDCELLLEVAADITAKLGAKT